MCYISQKSIITPLLPLAYSEHSETVGFVRAFEKYLRQNYHSCLRSELEERRAFSVDLKELLNNENVKTAIPELPHLVLNSPEGVISCLGLAMHQVGGGGVLGTQWWAAGVIGA